LDNLGENTIREIAMSRKVWLFCGNHDAAENAALFSDAAKLMGLTFVIGSFTF